MEDKTFGRWKVIEKLGVGGNGLVFRASDGRNEVAIKKLQKLERIGRFRDEIEAMKRLTGVTGVLPLIESHVPEKPLKNDPAWFAMPVAKPLLEALGECPTPESVIVSLRDIGLVLATIHAMGFSHRDIKPDNLFKYNELWSIGDFGLIEFDGKSHITTVGEKIGPMHFIAPEMLLGLPDSDGKAADVFSLSKTLWVLLTGANFPVPGAYDASSEIFQLKSYVELNQSVSLDKLIEQCTMANPRARPTMSDVVRELTAWLYTQSSVLKKYKAKPYEPVGLEWAMVIEAATAQAISKKKHNGLHAEANAARKKLFDTLKQFYIEVSKRLMSLGLDEVSGIESISPPGISIKFPVKTSHDTQLEMDFRVWLNADWSNLERKTMTGVGLCRMKIGSSGHVEELYRMEETFLIDGPSAMNFIEKVKMAVDAHLSDWLDTCAKKWRALP